MAQPAIHPHHHHRHPSHRQPPSPLPHWASPQATSHTTHNPHLRHHHHCHLCTQHLHFPGLVTTPTSKSGALGVCHHTHRALLATTPQQFAPPHQPTLHLLQPLHCPQRTLPFPPSHTNSNRLTLSGLASRLHAIYTYTYPPQAAAAAADELVQLYVLRGHAAIDCHRFLKPKNC